MDDLECKIVGPYIPMGENDWRCKTHNCLVEFRDPTRLHAPDICREEMICPHSREYRDRKKFLEEWSALLHRMMERRRAVINLACEAALQNGEHGVLVVDFADGRTFAGVHDTVPYGVIRYTTDKEYKG